MAMTNPFLNARSVMPSPSCALRLTVTDKWAASSHSAFKCVGGYFVLNNQMNMI